MRDATTFKATRDGAPRSSSRCLLTLALTLGLAAGLLSSSGHTLLPAQAMHGSVSANDVLYVGFRAGDSQTSPSCHQWLNREIWYGNNIRNYRWAGALSMCTADPSAIWRQLGIRNVNNDWPNMNVSTWHEIRHWNHTNVVAASRCRWNVPGGHIPQIRMACMYHRH